MQRHCLRNSLNFLHRLRGELAATGGHFRITTINTGSRTIASGDFIRIVPAVLGKDHFGLTA